MLRSQLAEYRAAGRLVPASMYLRKSRAEEHMSLAETLNALLVLSRRLRLKTGLPYVILGIAAGKCAGAVFYFFR